MHTIDDAPPRPVEFKVRDWRTFRALTQRDLGQAAGLQPQTIHYVETGRPPMARTIHKIANALGISIDELRAGPPVL